MIARMQDILLKAQKGGYAVGAFNTNNMEITQAIAEVAEELKSPVIIQTTPSAIKYAGLEEIYNIVWTEIGLKKTPIVLHLDHGKNFEIIKQAIDIGYPSVMIDASTFSFGENVHQVKRVIEYAHPRGVAVESEIGSIGKGEDGEAGNHNFTDPEQAFKFVELTKVDSLGVSIGNEHGAPEGEIINIHLLKKIREKVNIPLVLHGSSGLSSSELRAAIRNGVCKINIDTNIRRASLAAMRKELKEETNDYREVLAKVKIEVKKVVSKYIKIFGSEGKG